MMFEFYSVALCALLSILVCWTRSPFMSLMYAVLLFINASVVLLLLGFEFLALVNLLVYVGALAVLFLFVIMLLEIPATELRAYARGWSTLALLGILACGRLTLYLKSTLLLPFNQYSEGFASRVTDKSDIVLGAKTIGCSHNLTTFTFVPAMESINSLGEALYIHYADILILNSMVLTIALFGALVLAHIR